MILKNWSAGTGLKKYRVEVWSKGKKGKKIKTVQFGAKKKSKEGVVTPYSQFKDKTPLKLYSKYDHGDKERRTRYLKRHPVDYEKFSADWFSKKYLW
tara:strand:- start:592 stop:882 length:291 start_codon:yes stop_codon:yes gene_type:complete